MAFTIHDILRGTWTGDLQSAGLMQVLPLIGPDDDRWAAPDLEASTQSYGQVRVRNRADRLTLVPTGAAFVTKQRAQDHAVGSAAFVPALAARKLDRARCVQETQGGLIRAEEGILTILPAGIRLAALAARNAKDYSLLWPSIREHNRGFGLEARGNLKDFLAGFGAELDRFVAEFERVDGMLGAVILIGGELVGIERAPSHAYWRAVWEPLVRVAYGAVALGAARAKRGLGLTRVPLELDAVTSLDELAVELERAEALQESRVREVLADHPELARNRRVDGRHGKAQIVTVASPQLGGQVVVEQDAVRYAALMRLTE